MIVVAIIGALAAVAVPAYSEYMIRAKVSEVILATSACSSDVAEFVQTFGRLPLETENGCLSTDTVYVESVAWDGSAVVASATDSTELGDAASSNITLTPTLTDNGYKVSVWVCGGDMDTRFRPASCRG